MNEENIKYLNGYVEELKLRRLRKASLRKKKDEVKKLLKYLEERDLGLQDLGVRQAQEYQGYLLEHKKKDGAGYSRNTVATYLTQASSFYEYLKRSKLVLTNPFKYIRRVRMEKLLPKNLLKPKEMNRLLQSLEDFNKEKDYYLKLRKYRMHVLAEFLYATGMRISEAGSVSESDIDLEKGSVTIRDNKSKKRRVCFLNEYAIQVLKIYLSKMRKCVVRDRSKLFGAEGERLGILLSWVLEGTCRSLKLPKLTAHSFRHSFGYHLLKAGCDIRYIQELLGHERLVTTQIYTKVDKEDLRKVLDRHHPRKWRKGA